MKTHIVIHHSATQDNKTLSSVGDIRRYHMGTMGWRDIGYHFILDTVFNRVETFVGRLLEEDGAHTLELGLNRCGIGICVVGNFDNEAPTIEHYQQLKRLCLSLMRIYSIPKENVIGHREAQAAGGVPPSKRKTCPGKLFDMDYFRQTLIFT